jgi:hypothetical protein
MPTRIELVDFVWYVPRETGRDGSLEKTLIRGR